MAAILASLGTRSQVKLESSILVSVGAEVLSSRTTALLSNPRLLVCRIGNLSSQSNGWFVDCISCVTDAPSQDCGGWGGFWEEFSVGL